MSLLQKFQQPTIHDGSVPVYKQICKLPKKGKIIIKDDPGDEKYTALFNALKRQKIIPMQEGNDMICWDSTLPKLKWNEWMSKPDGMEYFSRDFDKYFIFDEKYRGHVTSQDYGI
jgi:hypothetical protein